VLELEPWRAFEFYRTFLKWYCYWYQPNYLEIGCAGGELCATLNTKSAIGIDILDHPDWQVYHTRLPYPTYFKMTSNEFLCSHFSKGIPKFGLIFIDGDHSEEQVMMDVSNSLEHLEDGGLIVLHDTLPPTIDHTDALWCGTAYRAAIRLRQRKDLEVYTFPVTFGLTLVSRVGTTFQWVL